jgi:hypothetical protein
LHSAGEVDDLDRREVTIRTPSRWVDGDHIFPAGQRREPDSQCSAAPHLHRVGHLHQAPLHSFDVEATLACGAETEIGVFSEFLGAQAAIACFQAPAKADLRRAEAVFDHQYTLIFAQIGNCRGGVCLLHPPGIEVLYDSLLAGLHPLLIEASIGAVGRALKYELAVWNKGRAQAGEGCGSIAGPARDLAAVEVLHRQTTACALVRSAEDTELAIEQRKNHLPDVRPASSETPHLKVLR